MIRTRRLWKILFVTVLCKWPVSLPFQNTHLSKPLRLSCSMVVLIHSFKPEMFLTNYLCWYSLLSTYLYYRVQWSCPLMRLVSHSSLAALKFAEAYASNLFSIARYSESLPWGLCIVRCPIAASYLVRVSGLYMLCNVKTQIKLNFE